MSAEIDRIRVLEQAASALAALVREEYPPEYTLAEIAEIWGVDITPEQVDALRVLEATDGRVASGDQP